jgi:hypothetical protein
VLERDGLQCSWVDARGQRCESRAWLELDHRLPRAQGGGSEPENLRLLCRSHNRLAAEHAYGRDTIAAAIAGRRLAAARDTDLAAPTEARSRESSIQSARRRQRGCRATSSAPMRRASPLGGGPAPLSEASGARPCETCNSMPLRRFRIERWG